MNKPILLVRQDGNLVFMCPGCGGGHMVWVATKNELTGSQWTWNGDLAKPSFSPSILINSKPRCHSTVTNGKISFGMDCDHALAGQTVDLPPWE